MSNSSVGNTENRLNSTIENVSRRSFLKLLGVGSTGLVLATSLPGANQAFAASSTVPNEANKLNMFVSIEPTGVVNIVCHRSEMGQGVRTSLPQIVADEMEANWDLVNVVQGLADKRYGSQNTDGSRSVRRFYKILREMGASARMMLEQAAANTWKVDVSQVEAKNGIVSNKVSGETLDYGQLSNIAATLEVPKPETIRLKDKTAFKYIGKEMPIVDMKDIQTGKTEFGQDIQFDNMLYACIARSPVVGANVASYDATASKKLKDVVDVWQMPEAKKPFSFKPLAGIAVVANNSWAAIQGRNKLQVNWTESENDSHDSSAYQKALHENLTQKGKVVRSKGDAYQEMTNANTTVNASYSVPYMAHAPMEPPAATAVYKNGYFEIWACTQTPQSTQNTVAQIMGVPPEKVKVHVTLLGGGFGRKSKPDYSVEAAMLAKQFGKPVKVVWTREDDIQHCYYHAISAQHYAAGLDAQGKVNSWIQRSAFPSISWTFDGTTDEPSVSELSLGFGDLVFDLPHLSCESHKAKAHTRIGWMRSVSNIHHAFALGSFVDEVAHAAKKPTYDMWMELIGSDRHVDPKAEGFEFTNYGESLDDFPIDTKRLKQVLRTVVEKSGANKAVAKNEGWGISVHRSFVTYVAVAVKVKVENDKASILEMHSAIDAGTVVNPDRVRAQQEGSMMFGASIALLGEISFKQGKVEQSNYHDYPVLRMNQSPKIVETYIIESDAIPGGVGEPGTPPVAAAIANAIFHACGKRIRALPIRHHMKV
ncbi:xanthine dehydrogenase family protein molybdopterin-binding subunit [Paraneptunicella aestuarii]|uniref:xanthine dehydrogenase family protein molybdopterin-binding subunit n=1 Tax=Paraneptunicella aestuarii TaxID=2831148 RepID=UPI001E4A192A|nr:molybdopterin cofactor-binding domain-containing protein [Paraneptunicella aestuarii]UAA40539.1 xanthine dehydrogenase family protein molybdopterin-binding subunit [Paraneptunicella aestuarii]